MGNIYNRKLYIPRETRENDCSRQLFIELGNFYFLFLSKSGGVLALLITSEKCLNIELQNKIK